MTTVPSPASASFPVIAIAASAGGRDALATLRLQPGAAYIAPPHHHLPMEEVEGENAA